MKKILLINFFLLLTVVGQLFAQGKVVSGKVTSAEDNSPLPGVNVVVQGTTNGTVTNVEGEYTLTAPEDAVLEFTFIGLTKEVVPINGRASIDVSMKADVVSLSEVVVTGYSTQNKREVTGSIATVKGETIANIPVGSFDQALQGRSPGVLVQASSGQPGAPARVVIRGKGSINGSNDPLFILDGVQISAGDFAALNPADFASYNILKDAAATAPYGSRGASGVIVITTKKGNAGKTRFNYNAQYGYSYAPENRLRVMNGKEKIDYELANGNPFEWTPEIADSLSKVNTDWADVLFQKGKTQSHTLSASGGSEKTTFYLSGSIFDQSGIVKNTGLERYTGRANIETTAGNLVLGLNSSLGYTNFKNTSEENTSIGAPLNAIRWSNPYETPYDADGNYTELMSGQPNALQELLENRNLLRQLKANGNVYLNLNVPFIKGLTLRTNWGADFTNNEVSRYTSPTTASGQAQTGNSGSFGRTYGRSFRYTGTTSATYTKNFATDHSITASIFNEIVKGKSNSFFFTGYGLVGAFQNEAGITPGTGSNGFIPAVGGNPTNGVNSNDAGENVLLSYFTLIKYGFKNRYFIDLSARRDGSSRFGADRRWANFGAVSLSWIVTDEEFMQNFTDVINELKLKASYGSAGNQAGINSFAARELYSRGVYNGQGGLVQTQLPNRSLQWETRNTFNTGFELATLNGRLKATVEYYNAITTDLFLPRPLSLTSGYSEITTNLGKLQNKGVELSLDGDLIRTKDFTWSANTSLTYNKNKILELGGENEIPDGIYIYRKGESINTLYLVRYAGVNPDNGNSIYLTKTGEKTEEYNPDDRVIVGSSELPFYGGFGSAVNYKGFEVNAFFSFQRGNKVYNNDRTNVENPIYYTDNLSADLLTEWRKPGDVTLIPRADQDLIAETTRFVESGNFLRLRDVNVSYTLPQSLTNAARLSNVKVYLQGRNLVTWTKFKGFDPEIASRTLEGAQYPALRTVTLGLSVGF